MGVILTVGPFGTPSTQVDTMLEEDKHYFHFSKTTLRSCYRSCISQANQAKLRALAISPLTPHSTNGYIHEEILRLGLQTLSEEVKFSQLKEVYVVGKSAKEVSLLIEMMHAMGCTLRSENVLSVHS